MDPLMEAEVGKDPNWLHIAVRDDEGDIFFKIKWTSKFHRIKGGYADRTGRTADRVGLFFGGKAIDDHATPEMLGLQDLDTLYYRHVPPPPPPSAMSLTIHDEDDCQTFYKLLRRARLGRVKADYAEKRGVDCDSIAFYFGGRKIGDEDTFDTLGLQDGDVVECMANPPPKLLQGAEALDAFRAQWDAQEAQVRVIAWSYSVDMLRTLVELDTHHVRCASSACGCRQKREAARARLVETGQAFEAAFHAIMWRKKAFDAAHDAHRAARGGKAVKLRSLTGKAGAALQRLRDDGERLIRDLVVVLEESAAARDSALGLLAQ